MAQPDFQAQVGLEEIPKPEHRTLWFTERAKSMTKRGATWLRYSIVEEHGLAVIEGWKARPHSEGDVTVNLTPQTALEAG